MLFKGKGLEGVRGQGRKSGFKVRGGRSRSVARRNRNQTCLGGRSSTWVPLLPAKPALECGRSSTAFRSRRGHYP